MSNPFNPFPNPFGTHAHIQQGGPVPGPAPSMQGSPQEEIRNQIMARVGQYGPTPKHRVRGAIGGQIVALQSDTTASGIATNHVGQWQTLLRDDHWHPDADGPFNANFKTLVTLATPALLSDSAGTAGTPLGMIVRLTFGVGGTVTNRLIVDVPTNGMVHVPFCGETVIAEVSTERKITEVTDGWNPDNPTLTAVNLPHSLDADGNALTRAPEVSGALIPGQGLATNPENMPTRQIAYILAVGGDSAVVPIPRGTQAVRVIGVPGDLVAAQVVPANALVPQISSVPLVSNVTSPLFSSTTGIRIISAADGGLVCLFFYLGI